MKQIVIFSILLACASNVDANIQRISPKEDVIQHLTEFHAYTGSSGNKRPNISALTRPGRVFVAKMDSFGMDRYFSFETNDDIDELVEAVMQGGGMGLNWYYFDCAQTAPQEKVKPKTYNAGEVYIADLPKNELARALFKRAKPQGMGFLHYSQNQELSDRETEQIASNYADYVHGRVMKIDITGDIVSTRLYNRENGENAAEDVIEELRATLSK